MLTHYLEKTPPWLLVVIAIVSIQLGSALATQLFAYAGSLPTAAGRLILSALLLLLWVKVAGAALLASWRRCGLLLCCYGASMALMNVNFYLAIERIPLGTAVAIEFIGPLGLSIVMSRRPLQLLFAVLAIAGVALLSPFGNDAIDTAGALFAATAGFFWACFIVLTNRVAKQLDGHVGLALGMAVAAVLVLPLLLFWQPRAQGLELLLAGVFAVALLSTAIPFVLEFSAIKRVSSHAYGILVSLEPGIAALIGWLLLAERLTLMSTLGIALVVIAAAGISASMVVQQDEFTARSSD